MRRTTPSAMDGPGQDSFLDIVANLVGILIILVMVVGVRAKNALLEAAPVESEAAEPRAVDVQLADAESAAAAVEADIFEIDAKIERQEFDIEYRRAERERVQLLVKAFEGQIEQRRNELDESQQEDFDVQREVLASQAELQRVEQQTASVRTAATPVAVIEHLPTPMAKTVFGRELHVSLRHSRLTVIPWDQLVAKLQEDAPRKVWRLKDEAEMTETLGPIGGFWMKYTLARKRHTTPTKIGIAVQQGIELDHFVLLPVSEDLGEDLQTALSDGSQFRAALDRHKPEQTTVTVWTYPDSFHAFGQLKRALYPHGYLVASRPLPEGFPIGGSPRGLRSAAQ